SGAMGVLGDQIDAVARGAPLREKRHSSPRQGFLDIRFEAIRRRIRTAGVAQQLSAAGGKLQVEAKQLDPSRRRPVRIHVVMAERGNQSHTGARASYGNVQTPVTAFLVQRTEPIGQAT